MTRGLAFIVVTVGAALAFAQGCTSIDPGPNYVVPAQDFNESYFYCFVEPKLIFGKKCGDNGTHGCHFSDKVPEMELTDHAPIQCANGQPVDPTTVGNGTPANSNYSAVSLEMDTDWMNAPIYIWPTQIVSAHPVQAFAPSDPVTMYLATWASL